MTAVDWSTVASLATAGGTLVLAIATFASIRSANRSARLAERALMVGVRPVLMPSRLGDPEEKFRFSDDRWVKLGGGRGLVDMTNDVVYLGMALQNIGQGLAVLDGWHAYPGEDRQPERADVSAFRHLTRDLFIAPGGFGFWQGTIREVGDPQFESMRKVVAEIGGLTVDLLYGDQEGGQRMVTRFFLERPEGAGANEWMATASRHWNLDRPDPR